MKPKTTPDERFLCTLYEMALKAGDPYAGIDVRKIGKAIGQKEIAIKNIVKHLAQANLLKKLDETTVCLTERGCEFARS